MKAILLLALVCLLAPHALAFPVNMTDLDGSVDINRAKRLAKYSNVAYCSEKKVMNWDCNYCRDDFKSFVPVQWVTGDFDTHGFLGYDDSTREIMVVMQGSASIENWIANLQFLKLDYDYPGVSGAKVHSGFYKSSRSLYENMFSNFNLLLKNKPGYKVVITGHSQGGATAAMIALFIAQDFSFQPEVQTFGEPRLGNKEYADYWKSKLNQNILRFTHKRDPVPQLPPTWIGFHHHPTEVWLQDGHGNDYKVCDWSGEDPSCHNSVWLPVDIFDHLWYLDIYLGIPCI